MKKIYFILLVFLLFSLPSTSRAAQKPKISLEDIRRLNYARKYEEAIKASEEIVNEKNPVNPTIYHTRLLRGEIFRRAKQYGKAHAEYRLLQNLYKDKPEIWNKMVFQIGAIYIEEKKFKEALLYYQDVQASRGLADPELSANLLRSMAYVYRHNLRDNEQALQCYIKIMGEFPNQKVPLAEARIGSAEIYTHKKQYDEAIKNYRLLLAENSKDIYFDRIYHARIRLGDLMTIKEDFEGTRQVYKDGLERETRPQQKAMFSIAIANSFANELNYPKAIEGYRNILFDFPEAIPQCLAAHKAMISVHLKQPDYSKALLAAKIYFLAAADSRTLQDSVNSVVQAFKAADNNLLRSNEFLRFQKYGPDGMDGKPKTDDDIKNPLDDVGFPSEPEIEKSFEETIRKQKKNLQGRRAAAFLYLFWGKPKKALILFNRNYRNCPIDKRGLPRAANDVVVGLKALHGHTLFSKNFYLYQRYGPKGKDEIPGTEDDLTDPLKEF